MICAQTFPRPELLSDHITNSHSNDNSLLPSTTAESQSQFQDPSSATTAIMSGTPISTAQTQMSPVQFPQGSPGGGLDKASGIYDTQQQGPYFNLSMHMPSTSTGMSPGSSSATKVS